MKPSHKIVTLLIASSIACMALAGCGNKGPLVKPSATPAPAPEAAPATGEPAPTPASEPASGTPAARR